MTTQDEVLQEMLDGRLARLHTGMAGKVIAVDMALQKVTVQPPILFRRVRAAGENEAHNPPPIPGVPIAFFSTLAGAITADVVVGDLGWLMFGERSHEEWFALGTEDNEPQDPRRHALADAVFLPGVRPFSSPLPPDTHAPGAIVINGADVRLGDATATEFVALASFVLAELNSLKTAFDAHTHVYIPGTLPTVVTGPGPVAPVVGSVAATKVKAK